MFRIVRCHEAEEKTRLEDGSSIPVFAIIATKIVYLSQTVSFMLLLQNKLPIFNNIKFIFKLSDSYNVIDNISLMSILTIFF